MSWTICKQFAPRCRRITCPVCNAVLLLAADQHIVASMNIVECKNYTVRSVVVVCGQVLNDTEETSANYPPTVFFTGDGEGGNCGI